MPDQVDASRLSVNDRPFPELVQAWLKTDPPTPAEKAAMQGSRPPRKRKPTKRTGR